MVGSAALDERHLGYARGRAGGRLHLQACLPAVPPLRPAPRRHGVLLQFDYSMPYGSPALQEASEFRPAPRRCCWRAWLAAGALHPALHRPAPAGRRPPHRRHRGHRRPAAGRPLDRAPGCGSWGSLAAMEQLRQALAGLCPSSGPWSRSAPRRWPPWPTTSRPPVHRQRQRGAAGGGRPPPAQQGGAWTPFSAAPAASGTIWSSCAPHRRRGARREAGGQATAELSALAEGWAAAGRGLCAPGGCAFSLDCPRLPPLYPVPVRVGPGGAQPAGQRRPLHPAGGRGAPVGVCGEAVLTVAVEDSGPGFSPRPWPGRGGAFTPATLAGPGRAHMGMGLTFARQAARRHGGTLDAVQHGPGRPGGPPLPL